MRRALIACLLLVCLAPLGCDGRAERQIADLTAKVEKLQGERDALESDRAALEGQIEGLKTARDALVETKGKLKDQTKRADELEHMRAEQAKKLQALEGKVAELTKRAERSKPPAPVTDVAQVRERLQKMATALFQRGDYETAYLAGLSARQCGAQSPELLYQLAFCRAQTDEFEDAAALYRESLSLMQKVPSAYRRLELKCMNNLGVALWELNHIQEAAETFRQIIAKDETYAPAYFNLGLIVAKELNDPEEAVRAFRGHITHGGKRAVSARDWLKKLQDAQGEKSVPAGQTGATTGK
ncbi:MAG: tetratricopeptide repeat protein [Planctomycetes bacterium]|nr:tetratricopeptide repeat protein [Planctomycetota bacterium]